jgi:CRISPR-associated endonuclease Csn1
MEKTILGLDLGTNSIGWALINQDFENKTGKILGIGSRIIPMSQDILSDFGKGNTVSQTAERTSFRSTRRLRERHLLRRERLHRVLGILGFLPTHYASEIDFQTKRGKFLNGKEPKLAYQPVWEEESNKYKYEFIFLDSFNEMITDFQQNNPEILTDEKGKSKLVPFDWTIYYLRKKGLTQKIKPEELAWLLLNFNQKRGYYQLRDEQQEENPNKLIEFHALKITDVVEDELQKGKTDTWYSLKLENGWVYRRSSKIPLFNWKGKTRDFIVTTELNEDGSIKTDKEGNERRSFKSPGDDDWTLLKKKTEKDIIQSTKTVGAYIYDTLLQNPKQKIKGKLVRTIERTFYKEELKLILQKQTEFHSELNNRDIFNDCIRELYRNNKSHQLRLNLKDFSHLFVEDIIFYQRPLSSQKSSIGNCTLESRKYKDKEGIDQIQYLKGIPKSNPNYQEFRIWQWIYNLSIYRKEDNTNITNDYIQNTRDWEDLFSFLNQRKEIEQKNLIKYLLEKKGLKGKLLNSEADKFRWNYVEDKIYPCNETKNAITTRLIKVNNIQDDFLTREIEQQLWHLIYSVTDKIEYEKALNTFALKHDLDVVSFVDKFIKFPPFKSEYGSYSEKALKKLLPLMRIGKYWNWDLIDENTKDRIDKLLSGEFDETIKNRVRENTKKEKLEKKEDFQGLPEWLAKYVIYDHHSEAVSTNKWNYVTDLDNYLHEFKQHSLRNPIVEQVITETLRVVKDIWVKYGKGKKDFFTEIHIELGREMKNTQPERKKITNQITENENTNHRLKKMLAEMLHDKDVENVRPYSPTQLEALKIYEDGVLNSGVEIPDDILKISKTAQPSNSDLLKYKLWLEQKYRSPYTGEIIPLNRLFTSDYEIEHIIPQSRYFDDSFSNKVICESAVNKQKDNQIGLAFIKNHHGEKIELGMGKTTKIFEVEDYEKFIRDHYANNRGKRLKLLMEDIPEKMIERQMNDTRYISKFVTTILSCIVRDQTNDDGINSKNVIPGNGKITTELKQDWGLNDVWNELILPRFDRMNQINNTTHFTTWNENHKKRLPTVPIEYSIGFSKKRIDHRHHAMDALVIACATRDHVNLLNNQSAKSEVKRFDLQNKLRRKQSYFNQKENRQKDAFKEFLKPWESFTIDSKLALESIIVSFKQNLRVINKATNKYEKWIERNGIIEKQVVKQSGTNWAIRKPMHKDTVSGLIQLKKIKKVSLNAALDTPSDIVHKPFKKEILSSFANGLDKKAITKLFKDVSYKWNGQDISKVEIYDMQTDNVASRVSLNDSFDEKKIESITDTGIQKILLNHLSAYKGRKDENGKEIPPQLLAFAPEGIEEMNKNIVLLNNGKPHQPILKVRTYEPRGNKFNVGETGNKKYKYVEAAKGTNLFFAVYQDSSGKRNFETIPLNIVIERQKQGLPSVPEHNEKGDKLLFQLSPNDLVYVPAHDEIEYKNILQVPSTASLKIDRIYKFVSCTGNEAHFVPINYAKEIIKNEMGTNNKSQNTIDGEFQIKSIAIKLSIDRIGLLSK